MKKRALSIAVAVLILCSILPAYAAHEQEVPDFKAYADALYELGLFAGTNRGYELDRVANRTEAAVMVVKMLGKDTQAKEENNPHPFTDVPAWANPYVGYLYTYGLTSGFSETVYGAQSPVTSAQYATFMLRSLGYKDSAGDFAWKESISKMRELGILSESEALIYTSPIGLPRGIMAAITRATLLASPKKSYYSMLHKLYRSEFAFTSDMLSAAAKLDSGIAQEAAVLGLACADRTTALDSEEIYIKAHSAVFLVEVFEKGDDEYAGTASGFFITSDGVAVTNYHVIEDAYNAKIRTVDGATHEVEYVLGVSEFLDIAILKIKGSGFPYLRVGSPDLLRVAQRIYCIGSPLGYESTITEGLVSSTVKKYPQDDYRELIQISAATTYGSSGGVMLNEYGDAVGITTMGYIGQNLNFAVPITQIANVTFYDPPKTLESIMNEAAWDWSDYFLWSEEEEEPNDEEPVQELEDLMEITGSISDADDIDLYGFSVEAPSELEITLRMDQPYAEKLIMDVIDLETGDIVLTSRKAEGVPYRYIFDHLKPGDYALRLCTWLPEAEEEPGDLDEEGSEGEGASNLADTQDGEDEVLVWTEIEYKLFVQLSDTATSWLDYNYIDEIEPNDDFETAQYIPFCSMLIPDLSSPEDVDFFRFYIDEEMEASVLVEAYYYWSPTGGNLKAELYDSEYELITEIDLYPDYENYEEPDPYKLKEGQYYIKVWFDGDFEEDDYWSWDYYSGYYVYVGYAPDYSDLE